MEKSKLTKIGEKETRQVKSMLIIFFHMKEIVYKEFILAGQSVPHTTVTFYGDSVRTCEEFTPNFGDKRTGCCITKTHRLTLLLEKDDYRPSPDLAPSDFCLQIKLNGRHFDTTDVMEAESQNTTSRMRSENGIRWEGDYFEGDGGQLAQI
jgi:hypothetical protein